MHILLIEDDADTARHVQNGLTQSGHTVDVSADGNDGLAMATDGQYEVLVVDRMLPSRDGLTLIDCLRQSGDHTPVLILSALGDVDDRIAGLKAGGDDYLPKPFAFNELLARIEALARRADKQATATHLAVGNLQMDLLTREVHRDGKLIALQPREFRLLEYLMRHSGQVITRTMLLEGVWDYHFDPQTNVIDVHISRLRAKIDRHYPKRLLHTVRGAGYILRESE